LAAGLPGGLLLGVLLSQSFSWWRASIDECPPDAELDYSETDVSYLPHVHATPEPVLHY
jgi:hypothetical protein